MNTTLRSLSTLACAAMLGACASVPGNDTASTKRECFFIDSVSSFTPVDETTVDLHIGARDVYQLTLYGRCPDIKWDHALGLKQRGGARTVCAGQANGLSIIPVGTPGGIGPKECMVREVRKLPPKAKEAGSESGDDGQGAAEQS
jgi:hypothetical protein